MIENDAFAFSLPPSGADYLPSYPLSEKISEEQVQPQSASRTLFCLICSCLMKSPISLPCGHTFCCKCLRSWMNVKLECPTCRGQIPSITLRKNITINDMIQEVPLKCPANLQCEKVTCKAHITVRDLADHTNRCPHILLTCKCKILIPRGSFLESEQKCECPEITCKYCLNKFQERLIRFHSDSCQNEQMKCSLCHTTMLRKDWIRHESKECFAPCPYVKYGCKSDKLSPIKLKEHITEELSNHKLLLVQFIQPELAQKVDRLSKELETHKFTPPKCKISSPYRPYLMCLW